MRRGQFTFLATTTNRPFSTWSEQVERVSRGAPPVQAGGKNGLYNGAQGVYNEKKPGQRAGRKRKRELS